MTGIWAVAAKIGLSALLGGAVGAEREWTGKWAGLRTHMLIAVGSALLTDVSIRIGPSFAAGSAAWDPGRIAAQIVSGVGFIGAGTIIQSRGTVQGLTTATGLWVASAIGIAVGAGYFLDAALGTLALLVILAALRPVESLITRGERRVTLVLAGGERLRVVADLLDETDIEPQRIHIRPGEGEREVTVRFRGTREQQNKLMLLAADRGLAAGSEPAD